MEYALDIEGAPERVPGGTAILLRHPSTVETDRVDTEFLKEDSDQILVISTRTTAREVRQKLDHYGVDPDTATILDTLSVERGYTRRKGEGVRYLSAPEDLDGLVAEVESFLTDTEGKRRISLDSLTEMIYYADEQRTFAALESLIELLETHDAVGLFHLAEAVHDAKTVEKFAALFDGVLVLEEDGTLQATF